ncbi:hypothetical protein AX16_005356 [Volvariella volvacea WC 439]|nr:hypothetical protein AX16_005356 [Volvariella volvacea WC 439]
MSKRKDIYFVIGGSGFVGRHIVQQLLARGDVVSVFDIVQRYDDTPFYSGDITDQEVLASALRKCGASCIIHTASPSTNLKDTSIYYKVNVDGTKAVIAAAIATGVRKLVFTSSASVVFDGRDLANADERIPYPETPMDAYNDSKAQAEELVLKANGKNGLLTVALRPSGIFGPGNSQVFTGFYEVYQRGQTHFQLGDNTNLFDWTYVGNVAKAHLLAADKLDEPSPASPLSQLDKMPQTLEDVPPLSPEEEKIVDTPLPPVDLTTGKHRIPTCEARPLGPYITPPPNAEQILNAFNDPDRPSDRRVTRNRFDPLAPHNLALAKLQHPDVNPLQIAGQAFNITNGEPFYFWDFARTVWAELDKYFPDARTPRKPFVLPRSMAMTAAGGAEFFGWLTGRGTPFTRFRVKFSCATRWFNCEKARRVLGYEPDVGVEEGIKLMAAWWYETEYKARK